MEIRFEIEKLGPVTDSEFELKPLLIFSGESSLGKSYTALLVYSFYEIVNNEKEWQNIKNLYHNISFQGINNNFYEEQTIDIEFDVFEKYYNQNVSRIIGYLIGYEDFNCNVKIHINCPLKFKFQLSMQNGHTLFNGYCFATKIESSYESNDHQFQNDLFEFVLHNLRVLFKGHEKRSHFILPPARGGFIDIPLSAGKTLIGMYQEFIEQSDLIKAPSKELLTISPTLAKLLYDIFQGKIKTEKNITTFVFNGSNIPISAAASSIKELSPLFLLLKKYHPQECMILWEEPETHLHPVLQRQTAKLISLMVNNGAAMVVTTHSNYFFNQINNLIKLHTLKNKKSQVVFSKILKTLKIDEQFILNPDTLGAYFFEKRNSKTAKIVKQQTDFALPTDAFRTIVNEMMVETDTINDFLYE